MNDNYILSIMKTEFLIGFLMILLVCGCAGPGEAETKVVGDVEFRILDAEYESGRIIVTLSTNASVDNARIDIIDEADKLLCTRYKDLIAGTTEIELSDCKAKEEVTVSVSPPGGGIVTQGFALAIPVPVVEVVDAEYLLGGKLELKLKANMDIEITLEILSMAEYLEHVVLITGDGDFVALVDWLSKRGKRITVVGLGRGYTSVELIRASDDYYNLDEVEGVIT